MLQVTFAQGVCMLGQQQAMLGVAGESVQQQAVELRRRVNAGERDFGCGDLL